MWSEEVLFPHKEQQDSTALSEARGLDTFLDSQIRSPDFFL